MIKYILLFFSLLIPSLALGADGDSVADSEPWAFILCDGAVLTSDRTCPEFDIFAKTGLNLSEMQFSIEADTSCTGTEVATINLRNQAGGKDHQLAVLNSTTSSKYSKASTYSHVSVTITGEGACTVLTIWGRFNGTTKVPKTR